jgi:hypothetical protein
MTTVFRLNGALTAALAAAFYVFFMFAKHDPILSSIVPFSNDPYDAIGSFAAIYSILLVLIALVRAFRPYRSPPTEEQKVFLVRTQMAVALAALITVVSDGVAMARHVAVWPQSRSAGELVALVGGMGACAIAAILLIRRSMSAIHLPVLHRWTTALGVSLAALLILAIYPEGLIQTLIGHLFTIFIGMLLLFAPLASLDMALVPFLSESATAGQNRWRQALPWMAVLLVALGIGLLAFLGETSEGGGSGVPLARLATVFAVFVGVGAVGVVMGYAFLRKPLGLPQ